MSQTTIWIIAGVVAAVVAIAGYIIYRKRKQYDFVFKMMKESKKIQKETAEKEAKEAAFKEMQVEKSEDESSMIIAALGTKENIEKVEQCAIRLRVYLKDNAKADQRALKKAGVSGVIKTTKNLQLIVGDRAEMIHEAIEKELTS